MYNKGQTPGEGEEREAWYAVVHGTEKSLTWLGNEQQQQQKQRKQSKKTTYRLGEKHLQIMQLTKD